MMNKLEYLVAFNHLSGNGRVQLLLEKPVDSFEDIIGMEKMIIDKCRVLNVGILNYILLNEETIINNTRKRNEELEQFKDRVKLMIDELRVTDYPFEERGFLGKELLDIEKELLKIKEGVY